MTGKKIILLILLISISTAIFAYLRFFPDSIKENTNISKIKQKQESIPLSIEYMRKQEYPGSEIIIEQALPDGSNYSRYIASYKSEGLKIYALLTVPLDKKPENGFPVIIFNHGYIAPAEYRTTERYAAYTDAFSRNGYVVFRPDYRGHGDSEGRPDGAYYSPAYTIDVLNAVASIKRLKDPLIGSGEVINSQKIGMWGHSMGGSITLRSMVTTTDVKAGVIWAGVVASYEDMAKNWRRSTPWVPSQREQAFRRPGRQALIDKYGDFDKNPEFWNSISPISFVKDVSGPIQLHHGTSDDDVPVLFSQKLEEALKKENKTVEIYTYPGDDHNISQNLSLALQRSVDFFNKNLK